MIDILTSESHLQSISIGPGNCAGARIERRSETGTTGKQMRVIFSALVVVLAACTGSEKVYHVSVTGLDGNPGTEARPFKTISAAASVAGPGDTITVHEGVYRERVNPPRGGSSERAGRSCRTIRGE
jgi:hypothetical protein